MSVHHLSKPLSDTTSVQVRSSAVEAEAPTRERPGPTDSFMRFLRPAPGTPLGTAPQIPVRTERPQPRPPVPPPVAEPAPLLDEVPQPLLRRLPPHLLLRVYAQAVRRHAQVLQAVGQWKETDDGPVLRLHVHRRGGRGFDALFALELRRFLAEQHLDASAVQLAEPGFVPLQLGLTVCVAPGWPRPAVAAALEEVLSSRLLPDGRRGLFHPDNFTFGDPLYLSQLTAAAATVPGVLWAEVRDFPVERCRHWEEGANGMKATGYLEMGPTEILRVDGDPSAPERGGVALYLRGGL